MALTLILGWGGTHSLAMYFLASYLALINASSELTAVKEYFYIIVHINTIILLMLFFLVELAWRSGSVMDCHATTRGSIPGGNSVFTELHVLRKGQ